MQKLGKNIARKNMKKAAVIMAGGPGQRLWPRSSARKPKQFNHFAGDGTMIENTFNRLTQIFDIDEIYAVTTADLAGVLKESLQDLKSENIIVEPFGKNTEPCMALSAMFLQERYGEDVIMAAFPSDHIIFNRGEFIYSVETALESAERLDSIVTIGIKPTRPETGFGYVQIRHEDFDIPDDLYSKNIRKSETFAEKPDKATAERFLESGDFFWNSGIFTLKLSTFWDGMKRYSPEDYSLFEMLKASAGLDSFEENLELTYRQLSSTSFDYAVLEKAENVYVALSSFRWSDLGTWDEHYRQSMKDAKNNVVEGEALTVDTKNCLISSKSKLIAVVGVEDLIVIDEGDAMLICKRGASDDVKKIIETMRRKNIKRFL